MFTQNVVIGTFCREAQLCDEFQNQNDEKESHDVLISFINKTIRQIHKDYLKNNR